jgi:hypothetical protein
MSRRRHARVGLALGVAAIAGAIAVPAFAATVPSRVKETTVGGAKFVPNVMAADTMHFKKGVLRIKSGGTLIINDKTGEVHTFSLVKKSQLPRNAKQGDNCFTPKGICGKIAVDHGAVNPETGEEQDPTTPLVNAGKAGFNQPGDSVVLPPKGGASAASAKARASKTTLKITAAKGKNLYFMCAIHPWMQGKVEVR